MIYEINLDKTFTSGPLSGITVNENITVYSIDAVYDYTSISGGIVETIPCAGKARYVVNNVKYQRIK